MRKLIMLLVGSALVLLSGIGASDCETTVEPGGTVVIEENAFVAVTMEDFEAYEDTLGAEPNEVQQTVGAAMIVEGRVWHVEGGVAPGVLVGCTKPKFLEGQVCEVAFSSGSTGFVLGEYLSSSE